MPNKTFLIIFTILAFLLGGLFYLFYPTPNEYHAPKEEPISPQACTQEAKLCPDGSYVGRTGPNCEFKACPLPPEGAMTEEAAY
jgi:hypothetical protein